MSKQFAFDAAAREALRRGLDQVADTVKVTLGPRGRNVILDKARGSPAITNDGVTIAKEIDLPDPFENLGAQLGKEVSSKTQVAVGDGTTTATVLTQAMVRHGLRSVVAGANPMAIKRGMDRATAAVVEEIARQAKRVRDPSEIAIVATLAANSDETLGRLVAEALRKVGNDGVVTIEEGKGLGTTLEVVEGMKFDRGYASPYFITDPECMEVELKDCLILIYDKRIGSISDLLPVLEKVVEVGRSILIVAEEIEGEALAALVVNHLRGTLKVVAVKAPEFGGQRKEMLEDLAVLTGGQVISEETGRKLDTVVLADLGRAVRATVDKDGTVITGGGGRKADILARADLLRRRIEEAASDYDREKLGGRLARLVGGVGVVRIGASTEAEMKETKARAEDALAATRAAVAEGIVPGGGVALLRAAEILNSLNLPADEAIGVEVVRQALVAPLAQIASNAGKEGSVAVEEVRALKGRSMGFNALTLAYEDLMEAGVIDPAKVVRAALQNANSIAGLILTTETLIAEVEEPEGGEEASGE